MSTITASPISTITITTTTAHQLVAGAAERVRSLTAPEFAADIDRGGAVLVDVRETDERLYTGSIRGAVHIPRGTLEFRADPTDPAFDARMQPRQRVLVYCSTGARSALAAETLVSLGYDDVAHLDGGVDAWSVARLPLFGAVVDPY